MQCRLKWLLILVLTIQLWSCEEEDTFDPNNTDVVIVEAYLYQGQPVNSIKISQLVPFIVEEGATFSINDAQVSIGWNNEVFSLILSPGDSGYYHYPENDLEIRVDDLYEIQLTYFGENVSAITTVPPVPEGLKMSTDEIVIPPIQSFQDIRNGNLTDLEVLWDNPNSDYYYIIVENIEVNPQPIDENGILSNFDGRNFQFITQPTNLDVYNIRGLVLSQYGTYRVRLFRVNTEYVDLYQTAEQDSRSLNEPLNNINNGLGIFTAFSSDSIFFEVTRP